MKKQTKDVFLRFLIIEDDSLAQINLSYFLRGQGEVQVVGSASAAQSLLTNQFFDMVFVDLDLERPLAGLELLPLCVSKKSYVVVLSGREEEDIIEKAYGLGAFDFLVKPFKRENFDLLLKKFELMRSSSHLAQLLEDDFITGDKDLLAQLETLKEVVATDRPIYLRGATGTGKTYIAKLIHSLIGDDDKSFVHLNCSEIPENLLESELFGHEKGAFTGAIQKKQGKLELADGGTLFLDEVATMPMSIQKKLLRVIEEKSFTPVGGTKLITSNFRLISATCDDLEKMVEEGSFRRDLFYRLEGHHFSLKDLADRRKDIPKLIRHFQKKAPRRIVFSSAAMQVLVNYSWPGNVRELQNLVELMSAKSQGIIGIEHLPSKFRSSHQELSEQVSDRDLEWIEQFGLKNYIENIENKIVSKMLEKKQGRIRDAFGALKISSSSFYRIKERLDAEE